MCRRQSLHLLLETKNLLSKSLACSKLFHHLKRLIPLFGIISSK
ncbi:hypothetical protein HanXRQr2_Chr02g0071151 [Helianthus annuus]|uniref:Uncharacterized protein n=1 Tax=Helianthus annuus TaxID=4232 RepID=A0A9K3JNE8_HELAN|nr:hypothetical protein HanXRQr2_Chr02g0071151 [Helianthus annuus]